MRVRTGGRQGAAVPEAEAHGERDELRVARRGTERDPTARIAHRVRHEGAPTGVVWKWECEHEVSVRMRLYV